jgi:hypothetical protein
VQLVRLASIATRYGNGSHQSSLSAASGLGCLSTPPALLMPPPIDLDMNVFSQHFTDEASSIMDLIPPIMAPPQQIPDHHAASPYVGGVMAPVQEQDTQLVLDLAAAAADNLAKMCHAGVPLWARPGGGNSEVMVAEGHARMFTWPVDEGKQSSAATAARTEGSRDNTVVIMNSITLVDAFLNAVSIHFVFVVTNAVKISLFILFCYLFFFVCS